MTFPEPPPAGDEIDTLLGSLERQRATLAWKCSGLDAATLRVRLGASAITLGGLLRHLAAAEAVTFNWKLHGRSPGSPWDTVDWDTEPDWDWRTAGDLAPERLLADWQAAVAHSRAIVTEALATGGLETLGREWPDGRRASLRRLLVDMIEEYARHVGHADLIRESIDGLTGEDPPGEPYPYLREAPTGDL